MTDNIGNDKKIPQYSEDAIIPVSPNAHIRRRPGMYFGYTDQRVLPILIWEVIRYSVTQAVSGFCNSLEITLDDEQQISIKDNGSGIPVEIHQDTGKPILELVLTELSVGYSERGTKHFRGGMFGVGIATVNAVSARMMVQVKRDGFLWQQTYREGIKQTEVEQIRPLLEGESTGTLIAFQPDFTIFESNEFDYEVIRQRLRELAFLVSGLTITLEVKRSTMPHHREEFTYPDGIMEYVENLNREYAPLHSPVVIRETVQLERDGEPLKESAYIEITFQYAENDQFISLGFVNTTAIKDGVHLDGFIGALKGTIYSYAKESELADDDMTDGLAAVVNIWYADPMFASAIMNNLSNPEICEAVSDLTHRMIDQFAEQHPEEMRRIAEKCLDNRKRRLHRQYGD